MKGEKEMNNQLSVETAVCTDHLLLLAECQRALEIWNEHRAEFSRSYPITKEAGDELLRLQAQYALQKVPQGKFILMNGPPSDNNAILFKAGQEEVLAPSINAGKVQVLGNFVMADWGQLGAWMKMEDFFAKRTG